MKKHLLFLFTICIANGLAAQITYISILDHNTGGGTHNNLFDHYVSVGAAAYIDYEVWGIGLTNADACGTLTQSRVVLRTTGTSDPKSVVASVPIYVTGICNGKNGNNDKYYVDLSAAITQPGRYSVEIQADIIPAANPFDDSSSSTNWNYFCPPAYYLLGASGPTGLYYTPVTPPCFSASGKSDPVGGSNVDMMNSIAGNLNYFTVGEIGTYREMVVLGGNYFDMTNGRFQPGNPALPASINGVGTIPATGICLSNDSIPVLSMGAEINVFKRTDCSADITNAKMFYRVYKNGTSAPAYSFFNIPWIDDCPGPSGPVSNIFPGGGSCNNINNVLDQRWQDPNAVSNILPGSLTATDSGLWNLDFYVETYAKNCAGSDDTITGVLNTTTFIVLTDTQSILQGCTGILPSYFVNLSATRSKSEVQLRWSSNNPDDFPFYVERSADGLHFMRIARVGPRQYSFIDDITGIRSGEIYYRVVLVDHRAGTVRISNTGKVNTRNGNDISVSVAAYNNSSNIIIRNISAGKYSYSVVSADGRIVVADHFQINQFNTISFVMEQNLSRGLYYFLVRNVSGKIVAVSKFLK